jgi:hypothetical protein
VSGDDRLMSSIVLLGIGPVGDAHVSSQGGSVPCRWSLAMLFSSPNIDLRDALNAAGNQDARRRSLSDNGEARHCCGR